MWWMRRYWRLSVAFRTWTETVPMQASQGRGLSRKFPRLTRTLEHLNTWNKTTSYWNTAGIIAKVPVTVKQSACLLIRVWLHNGCLKNGGTVNTVNCTCTFWSKYWISVCYATKHKILSMKCWCSVNTEGKKFGITENFYVRSYTHNITIPE